MAKLSRTIVGAQRPTRSVIGALILGGALIVALPAEGAQAASCNSGTEHFRGEAESGTGNNGTEAEIWTWKTWSVNQKGPQDFSDEGVWAIDSKDLNNALEVGFFSGYGLGNLSGGAGWTDGMVPYYTLNNGSNESDDWGNYLPANTYIWMYAWVAGGTSYAYVNGQENTAINYNVGGPIRNYTQGEVFNNNGVWMGGGSSGDSSTLYWLDSSGGAHLWGSLSDCSDSPYWVRSSNGTYYFANGGT